MVVVLVAIDWKAVAEAPVSCELVLFVGGMEAEVKDEGLAAAGNDDSASSLEVMDLRPQTPGDEMCQAD
jgi:hypothetical protein